MGWAAIVVPFASPYRPLWTGLGTVGVDLMVAVAVSSALRQRISARTWRGIHWLAYGSWPVAMAHSLGMGTDAPKLWMDVLAGACCLAVVASLAWRIADHRRSTGAAVPSPGRCRRSRARRWPATRWSAGHRSPSTADPAPRGGPAMTVMTVDIAPRLLPCPTVRRLAASTWHPPGRPRRPDHPAPVTTRSGGPDPAGRGRVGPARAGRSRLPAGGQVGPGVDRPAPAPMVVVNAMEGSRPAPRTGCCWRAHPIWCWTVPRWRPR